VQLDPIKTTLKPTGTQRLKLKCHVLLSTSAFTSSLRRYTKDTPQPALPAALVDAAALSAAAAAAADADEAPDDASDTGSQHNYVSGGGGGVGGVGGGGAGGGGGGGVKKKRKVGWCRLNR